MAESPQESFDYDVVVIGWGKAGKTLAKKAARQGKRIAMIERSAMMYGGTCINIACLPTKSLVHAAHMARETGTRLLGGEPTWQEREAVFAGAQEYRKDFVARLNNKNYHLLADEPTVDIYDGQAEFIDAHRLAITGSDGVRREISGKAVVINTGAQSRVLPWQVREDGSSVSARILNSTQALQLETLPRRLLIVGMGFIGLEFASYFANFGTEVTVLSRDSEFLPHEDRDIAQTLMDDIQSQGVRLVFDTQVQEVHESADGIEVVAHRTQPTQQEESFEADYVLVAAGRVPLTGELALERAGIDVNEQGAVVVDEYLRTSAPGVWAVGDVKGGPQFTFISLDDSRIVLPQILGEEPAHTLQSRPVYAQCTFVDPPYARVGLNELQAQAQHMQYTVHKLPTTGIPKAHVIGETQGLSKILVDEQGFIIGASLIHSEAHEMINLITLAINHRIPASELGQMIYTHPTFTESLNDLLG